MWKTLQELRILLTRSDKFRLSFLVLLTTVAAAWEVAGIGLLIPVVAAVVNPEILAQNRYLTLFYEMSPWQEPRSFMIFTAVLVLVNFALKNIFSFLVLKMQSKLIYRKQHELSVRLFRSFVAADYSFISRIAPAELIARSNRVAMACEGTLLPLMLFFSDLLVVIALLGALIWFMPLFLTVAVLLLILLALGFYLPFRSINSKLGVMYAAEDNLANKDKLTAFNGIKTVKTTACEEFFIHRFSASAKRLALTAGRIYCLGQLPRLWLEFLAVFMAMGIFAAMILCNVATSTVVLCFALLVAAIGRMLPALSRMQYNLTRIKQVRATFQSIFEDITQIEAEVKTDHVAENAKECHLRNALEIKDMSFAYNGERVIFDKFSLTVPAYTSVALVGPTGGGKTTLADLTAGLLKPDAGSITFDGVNINEALPECRKIIGYVPQYVFLMEGSLAENIAFGVDKNSIDKEKLQKVIEQANLASWINSLPDKSATMVIDGGINLSGGQRQRLGIARALYRDPELLILDEATSALDSASESAVVEALEKLHGKVTMLVIAHRLSTIEHCDKIVTIGK